MVQSGASVSVTVMLQVLSLPSLVTVTEKAPEAFAMMQRVVSPVLHK
jgi:hypothetical protein